VGRFYAAHKKGVWPAVIAAVLLLLLGPLHTTIDVKMGQMADYDWSCVAGCYISLYQSVLRRVA